jgi:NTP pyrophosphatase (non-canonical NTP hydrolase)
MTLNEYQEAAFKTAVYPEKGTGSLMAVVYTGLGLGEAGELQGKIKKVMRDASGKVTPEMKEAIIAEMGDTLWYLAALATELSITLEEVVQKNLANLKGRQERGTISGSGDIR